MLSLSLQAVDIARLYCSKQLLFRVGDSCTCNASIRISWCCIAFISSPLSPSFQALSLPHSEPSLSLIPSPLSPSLQAVDIARLYCRKQLLPRVVGMLTFLSSSPSSLLWSLELSDTPINAP